MGENRIKIGIIFGYGKGHIAVTYYKLNIIKGLKTLPDEEKPLLVIFCDTEDDFDKIKEIGYPYISKVLIKKEGSLVTLVNKATKLFFKKTYLGDAIPSNTVDILFPGSNSSFYRKIKNKLYWGGDFQDLYYPEYFSKRVLFQRKLSRNRISYNHSDILFSSYDSMNQYIECFPENNANKYVYQFTVTHPNYQLLNIETLKNKFDINKPFFITPNQFWLHKNHEALLEAIKGLSNERSDFQLILTGNEKGNGGTFIYANKLKQFVSENNLDSIVRFLGFIDRTELLKLIEKSQALIQPSFYEGWNTSIEDAKSMNKIVLASNIEVHKEQLGNQGKYFDPKKPNELKELMNAVLDNKIQTDNIEFSYSEIIAETAQGFLKTVKKIILI